MFNLPPGYFSPSSLLVQIELEKLNSSTDVINKLELDLEVIKEKSSSKNSFMFDVFKHLIENDQAM